MLGPQPFIQRRRRVVPESYENRPSPPWATENHSSRPPWKRPILADKGTLTDISPCKCYQDNPKTVSEPPIERTLSWECLEARRNNESEQPQNNKIPDFIVLPTGYFGKVKRKRRSPVKRKLVERPFYPPGVHISSPDFELQEKIRSARKKYRSPISRKRLGTPACYRRRVRTQSEPGERGIAFWAPLERCRSNPSISENLISPTLKGS